VNIIDIALIITLVISSLLALYRGFIYEILAMVGWVSAGLSTIWFEPTIHPFVLKYISNPTIAAGVAGISIFLIVLLISSMISHTISQKIRKSSISAVDRSLGFLFGLLRGLLVASLAFIVIKKLMFPSEPKILEEAKTHFVLEKGALIIQKIVPDHMADFKDTVSSVEKKGEEFIRKEKEDTVNSLLMPQPKQNDGSDDKDKTKEEPQRYDKKALNRILELNKEPEKRD
jgi:membrane protein required for colicin V production